MSTKSPYRVVSPVLKEPARCPVSVTRPGQAEIFAAGVMWLTNESGDVDIECLCGRKWERVATAKVRNGKVLHWRPL